MLRATLRIDPKARGDVVRMLVASARGKFWLKRSAIVQLLDGGGQGGT